MRIFVNGRFLSQGVTGVQRYAIEISRALVASGADVTILAPSSARSSPLLDELPVQFCGRLAGHAWEQIELPLHARGGLLLSLCNTGPVLKRRHAVVMHDAAVFRFPQAYSTLFRWWYRILMPVLGRTAKHVLTVSEFSRRELISACRVPAEKIAVTLEGGSHVTRVTPEPFDLTAHGVSGGRPYLLAVSSRNPTKNFARLVEAVTRLDTRNFDVVVAGGANPRVFKGEAAGTNGMTYVGYVSDEELVTLYRGAACFVTPSVYEGFGLPALEAMTLGCPVVAARAASLPEVCGDAAEYVDPYDPEDMAAVLARVMADPALRSALAEKGRRRAGALTWSDAAARMLTAVG